LDSLWMAEKLVERLVGKLVALTAGKKVEKWENCLAAQKVGLKDDSKVEWLEKYLVVRTVVL